MSEDYDGDFDFWQRELDAAGVDFDVSGLGGATYEEIDSYVALLLLRKARK